MDLDAHFESFAARDWQTADEGTVRVALVGLGEFSRDHVLPALAGEAEGTGSDAPTDRTSFCDITALVSGSPEKAESVADRYDVGRTLSYEEFEAGEGVDSFDAVYVAGPNALHLDHARTAARLGKHVLCEKPIETSAERAREMVRACEDAGVTLMVGYRPQVEPAMRRLRDLIRDGVLGDPVAFHGWFTGHILDGAGPDQWRLDPDLAGGGALMDVGVYPLNAVRFLLDADPVAAQATTSAPDAEFEGVDEHVAFQLEFPEGATASCTASYRAQADDRLRIVGTEGQAALNPAFDSEIRPELTLEVGDERVAYTGPYVNEVAEEFDYFAHCILTDARPDPDGRDSVADMEAVEAIYESAETGRRVEIGDAET
ncbi:Gfo/Idh/MocA family oxidoreductase [Halorussus gelatinilyticus]|uniref:Gfo/Idh/MocA family oxidoreductase n=1 Tax=Halorussus gelatinilyticus TaxID=2937524 RepID=A0A8U0IH38_9EURY|nr:D-xylose 1-dehydrogenase Gfo6 [Halorussus gelatinilyticus]UPW00178.1 Gfo/Idh/MocA family oxidoreductase [Halorussus gelatinilyticus]